MGKICLSEHVTQFNLSFGGEVKIIFPQLQSLCIHANHTLNFNPFLRFSHFLNVLKPRRQRNLQYTEHMEYQFRDIVL